MKYLLLYLIFFTLVTASFAQPKVRKLPNVINHPSINLFSPYMSFDGSALLYLSDNAEDYALTPFYTSRESANWKEPAVLSKNVHTRLNFLRGYSLSADGKTLYFTSMKSPGVGGYDLWMSELKGSAWAEPKNFTSPVNSMKHEACPSMSSDGKAIYFMRCEKMDQAKAGGCKIFVSRKKSNGLWDEPEELPASINTGNSQTPRIMADGETLYFSSDKMQGNKGGMDLYMTRFRDGQWLDPVPLDFTNSSKDDQYVSVTALGRYLLRDSPGQRKNELVEYLIPNDVRPRGLMKVEGKVSEPTGAAVGAYISVIDLADNKRVYNGRPSSNGSFILYLLEGSRYEMSVDPEQSNVSFFSRRFDLTVENIPQTEKVEAILKPINPGDEIELGLVDFKPQSSEINSTSYAELQRLARVIKATPGSKFEIQVMLAGYEEDSLRSNYDLTEMLIDSVHAQIDDIDTLGQLFQRDTLIVKTTYHNDRTVSQAQSVIDYLSNQGVDVNNLSYFVNARPEAILENRKIIVRARRVN